MDNILTQTPKAQIRLADLKHQKNRTFDLNLSQAELDQLADTLEVISVKKARLSGELSPRGKSDWLLTATLGATVVQNCAITLAPITTRIDEPITRQYLADFAEETGHELEMPEDDTTEALPDAINLIAILTESLSLALPAFPRADGARFGQAIYTAPGAKPMSDEDAKPFAGLGDLRDALAKKDD
jgi:uncharacterized metal-binding protein YceD (DUF177 family)